MLNTWVAMLQLTTTLVFLVGWIWSIIWSIDFVSISSESLSASRLSLTQSQAFMPDQMPVHRKLLTQIF